MNLEAIQRELLQLADPAIAEHSQRFFKTGPGEYAEGDRFLGIRVPVLRKLAQKFKELDLNEVELLLQSEYHEARLAALFILIHHFKKGNPATRQVIYELYLQNLRYINNWDLVDSSAEHLVGAWLTDKDRSILYKLATSPDLWKRRIAVMSTFQFIRYGDFKDTLELGRLLLDDRHDLIHKAVGWMLREIGKRDLTTEEHFLARYASKMPRTMLRYAIERFPVEKRKKYLEK